MSSNPSSISQAFAGLNRTPLLTEDGTVSWQWQQGLNKLAQAVGAPAISGGVPLTSSSAGSAGQIAVDPVAGIVYVCVATNKWMRATLSAF
jgi:hypothetical protein